MSGAYSLFEAAPVVNYGYYDVPICNKYSNKDNRDSEKTINEYNFNSKINNTLNDNKQQYLVQQYPTIPSPSLYIESNNPMAGYYNKLQKKSELKEHFSGTSAVDDYSYLYANDNNDGLFIASNTYSNYYETHDTKPDYLNAQNIPNISNAEKPKQDCILMWENYNTCLRNSDEQSCNHFYKDFFQCIKNDVK
jgi:hypothetical protein